MLLFVVWEMEATNEGSFHECLNMASNWDLPLIFYVINNKYGISMAQRKMYACRKNN